MSNSFDDKIKQALEEFEMPYDANAWAELEKQLPQAAQTAPQSGNTGLKIAAGVVIVSSIVATLWFMNQPEKQQVSETSVTEEFANETSITEVPVSETVEVQNSTNTTQKVSDSNVAHPNKESVSEDKTSLIADKQNDVKADEDVDRSNSSSSTENKKSEAPIKVVESNTNQSHLVVDFLPSSVNVCAGADVSFINNSSDMKANMAWDFGDGNSSTELNPVHSYVLPGTYTVTLTCEKSAQNADRSITVTVNPAPTPMFSSGRKLDGYVAIPLFNFSTGTQPGETAVWSFSDGSAKSGNSATHLFREAGNHKAKLTVTNQFGCSTSVDDMITTYDNFNLLAPNTFTPDGDGNNETFIPKALPEMGIAFEMVIRSQTGQVVFQTTNPTESWDGTLQNSGQKADEGIYVWTVLLKENIVSKKDFNGTIHLTR